ncbi:glycosyltransferase family 2 protein [Vibrio parahaemolyticus]|nr:glycosyltransferase family 2 protein [Vibrio parahaemolyticus]HBC3594930.1 glycosyltransferase family 2 protein [Vibrio parahaemolyticus]
MSYPLISVVIPVFNVSEYVVDSVESVLAQTYPNLEIIIVDDASTDGTYEVLINKFSSIKNIRIFKNDVNSKISYSLNYGIKLARGEYIARIDGDDIAMPDRIEKQYEFLISNSDISLVGCSLIGIDENGNEFNRTAFPNGANKLAKLANFSSPVSHVWLCRKSLYTELGGYRYDGVEDFDFLLRMKSEGYKFDNIANYFGMKIRHRHGNTASTIGLKQRLAFNYVRILYKARMSGKGEAAYKVSFEDYISKSIWFDLHSRSNKLLNQFVLNKSLYNFPHFLISLILSPYQFQYVTFRFIYKAMSKYL